MAKWWQERVVYQIYPRSFADTNGDGFGDIPGIIAHLDDLKDLGVGILWISPMYPSPDADNGYDISDYCDVDPRYGTMADMERLIEEAARRDIRLVMDLVINHTSDQHEWFVQSRDKESPFRDYYIWRPGKKNGGPPNNWISLFGGSAWTYDERSGEYYLHLFAAGQPDLNYRNPEVLGEVERIMRFWLKKGISGFRCDVINILWKSSLADSRKLIRGIEHYVSQPNVHEILHTLRATCCPATTASPWARPYSSRPRRPGISATKRAASSTWCSRSSTWRPTSFSSSGSRAASTPVASAKSSPSGSAT